MFFTIILVVFLVLYKNKDTVVFLPTFNFDTVVVVPTKIIIAKLQIISIIICAFGVSSNGRTRDFGSLYHGSNPCAPTNIQTHPCGAF